MGLPDLGRVLERAAADLQMEFEISPEAGDLTSASLAQVGALVDRLRLEEMVDPGEFGPRRGLAMVAMAWGHLRAGDIERAQTLGSQAVGQVMRFSDHPQRIQAALVAGLTVLARAARAGGRLDVATRAQERAEQIAPMLQLSNQTVSGPEPVAAKGKAIRAVVRQSIALIDEGIRLGRLGRYRDAEKVLTEAANAFALLWEPGSTDAVNLTANRQAARAWWRLSMIQDALGKRPSALASGRLGVDAGRMLLNTLPALDPDRPGITAEVATAATDLAEVAFAAGLTDEGFALLDDALAWCANGHTEALERALGTALHNRLNALLNAVHAPARGPAPMPLHSAELIRTGSEAVAIRRRRRNPKDPVSGYELANSLILLSITSAIFGDLPKAAGYLAEAASPLEPLEPGSLVDALRSRAAAQAALLEQLAPLAVDRYRLKDQWPY